MPGTSAPVHEMPASGPAPAQRILVAGIGNIFLGDDGFGSQVARELARHDLPPGVTVTDYGIRGMHLAYDLSGGWDQLILVDLLPARGHPGTVHIVEVGLSEIRSAPPDPHGMAPAAVLAAVGTMGGELPPTLLVGCEAVDVEERIGLSPPVAAAVEPAVDAVLRLLAGSGAPAAGTSTAGGH